MLTIGQRLGVAERRACQVLRQSRSTQRYQAQVRKDKETLTKSVVRLARKYGRYGYRLITALVRVEGWQVNHKRVERIWRREGLKVPKKQPKRGRLWINKDSCVRLRPQYQNPVWTYEFVATWTHDGRPLRLLTIVAEYTRECLTIEVARTLQTDDVLHRLVELFVHHGRPEFIRLDNGPEFIAQTLRQWYQQLEMPPLFIETGSPWENGYLESFKGKLRDELLNGEFFYTLQEAQIIIERWRRQYNTYRPNSALAYQPPAPETRTLTELVA